MASVWKTALGAAALAGVISGTARAEFNLEREHVPGQLIVKFKDGVRSAGTLQALGRVGADIRHVFATNGAISIQVKTARSTADLLQVARRLKADPNVQYVEANTIIYADSVTPNDPRFRELYGLHNEGGTGGTADADIDAPEAWAITTGSRAVVVGIIDTGVDYTHPDIAPNYWTNPGESGTDDQGRDKKTNGVDDDGNGFVDDFRGWDFVNNDNDPKDDHNHGTHCAGTIGASGDNGEGVAGVNWQVSMVGIKFLSGSGSGTLEDAVKAIEYGTKLGVTMTSNSWGGGGFSDTMDAAIRDAEAHGILFIAAAGNDGANNDSSPHYPSSYTADNIIAVAATDHKDAMASFSCFGLTSVDVGAPGVDILSSVTGATYTKYSGTSMATPHVAGVAALVKAAFPDATGAQIKARILNTVDPVPALAGRTVTGGRVNAANALEIDTVAPGTVHDLELLGAGTTSVQVRWTAAGDDGDVGLARSYQVRWAANAIETDADWEAARPADVRMGTASDAGVVELEVVNLAFNSAGYLAVKAVDNVGNVGGLSASLPFEVQQVNKIAENTADSMADVTADAPWGIEDLADGGKAFSDSPAGDYGTDINVKLQLPAVTISSSAVTLVVKSSHDFETGYDFGYIEASKDGGATWTQIDKVTGSSTAMASKTYDLSTVLAGATSLTLRFRVTSDYSINGDGWKIDNLMLFAPSAR